MKKYTKFNIIALGLALGITWGLAIFLLGLFDMWWAWGHEFVQVFSSLYLGYAGTVKGSIIGLVWGFGDAFIGGVVIAALYNYFNKKCRNN